MTQNTEQNVRRFRHIKRGTEYRLIGRGKLQQNGPSDMAEIVIYQDVNDGSLWVRSPSEFYDGRFKEIFDATAEARGAEEQRRKDAEGAKVSGWVHPDQLKVLHTPNGARDGERFCVMSLVRVGSRDIPLYTHPANVAALEARIAELVEAEQLARADAEAGKARGKVLEEALSAAASALEQVTDGERGGYNARNGKFVSLQMSDGERADIIHSDVTTECEGALETARAALTREGEKA